MPSGIPKNNGVRKKPSMANRCAVCRHPEKSRLEALHCAGASLNKLVEQFPGLNRDSIWRHMLKHVPEERKVGYLIGAGKIARLAEVAAEENQSLIDYFSILRSTLFGQLDRLAAKNDHVGIAAISARIIDVLAHIGKITGQISAATGNTFVNIQNNVQILNSAPFADLQAGLLQISANHPEIRGEMVALFKRLDEQYSAPAPAPKLIDVPAAKESAHA
jgi:hypothetical protein